MKLVSWDVDGTLYSLPAVRVQLAGELAKSFLRGDGRDRLASLYAFLKHRRKVEGARFVQELLPPGGDCVRFVREVFAPAVAAVGLRAGVLAALDAFDRRGVIQVVASDYGAADKLSALGIVARFKACYAGDSLVFVKPHPGMFERMARDFGVAAGDMLHIGDGPATDGAAAAAFGCRCLLVDRGGVALQELVVALNASQVRV